MGSIACGYKLIQPHNPEHDMRQTVYAIVVYPESCVETRNKTMMKIEAKTVSSAITARQPLWTCA